MYNILDYMQMMKVIGPKQKDLRPFYEIHKGKASAAIDETDVNN